MDSKQCQISQEFNIMTFIIKEIELMYCWCGNRDDDILMYVRLFNPYIIEDLEKPLMGPKRTNVTIK